MDAIRLRRFAPQQHTPQHGMVSAPSVNLQEVRMSDDDKSSLRSTAAFFSSVGIGTIVGGLTGSQAIGFAFGGVGMILSGIVMLKDKNLDGMGFLIGAGMILVGGACIGIGLAYV